MKKFQLQFQQYFTNIRIPSECNALTILNKSTTVPVYVNNVVVNPGELFIVEGNEGEIDTTEYFLDFKTLQGEVTVIRKMYV